MSTQNKKSSIGEALAIFTGLGLFGGVVVAALGKEFGFIEPDVATRTVGVLFGAILMVSGNYLPKAVMPISARRKNPARAMAAERFAGYVFVLAGLASAIVAFTTTAGGVIFLSSMTGLGAFVLVGLNWLILLVGGKASPEQSIGGDFTQDPQMRNGVLVILNALMWAFAMMVTDHYFGDTASKWLLVPFFIVNGLLGISMVRNKKNEE
jgi:hypothetical protein